MFSFGVMRVGRCHFHNVYLVGTLQLVVFTAMQGAFFPYTQQTIAVLVCIHRQKFTFQLKQIFIFRSAKSHMCLRYSMELDR